VYNKPTKPMVLERVYQLLNAFIV